MQKTGAASLRARHDASRSRRRVPAAGSGSDQHVIGYKPADVEILEQHAVVAGVDFIYLGSSSFLDENRQVFTGAAVEHGLPVLSPYERVVREARALLSVAARYHDVGRLAGAQAEKILVDGIAPGDLPVARMTEFAYGINMDVAKALDLYPPVAIIQIAEIVE